MHSTHLASRMFAVVLLGCLVLNFFSQTSHADERPNIVIIMADDMGYSDIGCYGGEIETPNLNALAKDGLRFTQFYNTARCCPTRASLLTGLHPHQAGIGHMVPEPGANKRRLSEIDAYQGFLNQNCVTIAEVLKPAGYQTLMSGKWHVGQIDPAMRPLSRGFEKYYGILSGGTNYFAPKAPRGLTLMQDPIEPEGDHYYLTDAFTDYAIRFLNESRKEQEASSKPFFLYLAYTAPHWPLQAPQETVDKYVGKYMMGWDKLRQERYQRMIEMGIIKKNWKMSPPDSPAWNSLNDEKKKEMDLRMAIYAAQVDRMDQNIGRVVETLKTNGDLENTVIFFLSDNGGCAEGGMLGSQKLADLNHKDTPFMTSYGQAWANASNTPFRLFKHYVHEGGISTPLIVHWPKKITEGGKLYTHPGYLPDLMATCVDLAEAKYPETFNGKPIHPMEGLSLRPAFEGKMVERMAFYWEHEENRAIREGDWKLVSKGPNKWELYNVYEDRTETNDLYEQHPEMAAELIQHWTSWALRAGVIPNGKKMNTAGE